MSWEKIAELRSNLLEQGYGNLSNQKMFLREADLFLATKFGSGHPIFDISVTKCLANRFKLKQTEKQTETLQTQTDPYSSNLE